MFSRASHAPERLEIIYSGENFTWAENDTAVARRRAERKRWILATCIAIALTAIVLGQSFGVAWLLTTEASRSTLLP